MNISVHVLTFGPDGQGHGLYTEAIELGAIGRLSMRRASSIDFNERDQQWEVLTTRGELLFSHQSREVCLAWEQQHFNSEH